MKYVVVCYSEHDSEIAEYTVFNKKEDAIAFMKRDINDTYKSEKRIVETDSCHKVIEDDKGRVESCAGEYRWTWTIIEVEV